jgi:hypothetical protein
VDLAISTTPTRVVSQADAVVDLAPARDQIIYSWTRGNSGESHPVLRGRARCGKCRVSGAARVGDGPASAEHHPTLTWRTRSERMHLRLRFPALAYRSPRGVLNTSRTFRISVSGVNGF